MARWGRFPTLTSKVSADYALCFVTQVPLSLVYILHYTYMCWHLTHLSFSLPSLGLTTMSYSPVPPPRPPTSQVVLHRLPDKSLDNPSKTKYIILIMGSTAVAGELQITHSVANGLSCPYYEGDSIHESAAKAVIVGH